MKKKGYVYILSNGRNGTLYTGVTKSLRQRILQHKEKTVDGFTARYTVNQLVYVEVYDLIVNAITREKRLKRYKRQWKIKLIEKENPDWLDLTNDYIMDCE